MCSSVEPRPFLFRCPIVCNLEDIFCNLLTNLIATFETIFFHHSKQICCNILEKFVCKRLDKYVCNLEDISFATF